MNNTEKMFACYTKFDFNKYLVHHLIGNRMRCFKLNVVCIVCEASCIMHKVFYLLQYL